MMDSASTSTSSGSGTLTSSQDPQSQRSRVFVGNLNTAQVTRSELEQRFSRYGPVIGVSVHKGFGFVQFADEWAARAAVQGEDGQVYYGMRVDANIASEPKVRRAGIVPLGGGGGGSGQPALKRPRQDILPGPLASLSGGVGGPQSSAGPRKPSNLVPLVTPASSSSAVPPEAQPERRPTLNDPSVKDLLVCGNCKELLPSVDRLAAHKAAGCRLRLVCRCAQAGDPVAMDCAYCGAAFASAWELLLHCRDDHDLLLFGGVPSAAAAAAGAAATAGASTSSVKSESNGQ